MAKVEQLELTVLDRAIHCSGCESRIQSILGKLSGVVKVKAHHKTQLVNVTMDSDRVSPQQIKEKLGDLGYKTA